MNIETVFSFNIW